MRVRGFVRYVCVFLACVHVFNERLVYASVVCVRIRYKRRAESFFTIIVTSSTVAHNNFVWIGS